MGEIGSVQPDFARSSESELGTDLDLIGDFLGTETNVYSLFPCFSFLEDVGRGPHLNPTSLYLSQLPAQVSRSLDVSWSSVGRLSLSERASGVP